MSDQTDRKRPSRRDTFIGSLHIQGRVIGALFLREIITRYGRDGLGFLWLFLEPMLFSVGITILWTVTGMAHTKGDSMPVAGFALTGYSSIVLWRNMVNRLANSTTYNKGLLYHPNVKVVDLIYSRALLEFAACTTSLMLLSFAFWGLGLIALPIDPLKVVFAWMMLAWFVISAGMLAAFLSESSEMFDRLVHIIMYLTLPLTGALTMVSWTPASIQNILLYSPLVHAVEMLREGYFGESIAARYSISYLFAVNLVVMLIGLILIRNIRRKLTDG